MRFAAVKAARSTKSNQGRRVYLQPYYPLLSICGVLSLKILAMPRSRIDL
jgi:hypothetical protein